MRGCLVSATLVALLTGCSEDRLDPQAIVAISPSFSMAQQQAIILAGENWSDATRRFVRLRPVIGDDVPGAGAVVSPVHLERGTIGVTDHGDVQTISLDPWQADDRLTEGEMHELGHAFGLHHAATGLMMADGGAHPPACVDRATLEAFCGVQDCDSAPMRDTCK